MTEVKITTEQYMDFMKLQHAMAIELQEGSVTFENPYTQERVEGYINKLMNI